MTNLAQSGYSLGLGMATVLLTACGGSSLPAGVTNATASADTSGTRTFKFSGEYSFKVPKGVTHIRVDARGAAGAVGHYETSIPPARGGRVVATISVQPGEKLYVFVGGQGEYIVGGFNGGGEAGIVVSGGGGFGGGGASDVRANGDTLRDRIIVAGGGGGQGEDLTYGYSDGGAGGGLRGRNGGPPSGSGCSNTGRGGGGGRQPKGGFGGSGGQGASSGADGQPGTKGILGNGGDGGDGGSLTKTFYQADGAGGGGGGGYYGGGGGGGGAGDYARSCGSFYEGFGGGGGGGSSYIERGATNGRIWSGYKSAQHDGLVIFRWR
jgi:Glycine rich protein